MPDIDSIQIQFSAQSQWILQCILGLIIFGIALDVKVDQFKEVLKKPLPFFLGLFFQFVLFPALTFILLWIACCVYPTAIRPSLALGMILVAACPGGNMSNFFTHLANGNTALSISMSTVSTLAAVIMTPLNFSLWGYLLPCTQDMVTELSISFLDIFITILTILVFPLGLGMLLNLKRPKLADLLKKPFKQFSIAAFVLLIGIALSANFDLFLQYITLTAILVCIQNAMAIGIGFWGSHFSGLSNKDARTIAIEVGIQNSGLGLLLFFQYLNMYGGVGIVTAWWGIWHMIAGLTVSLYWQKK